MFDLDHRPIHELKEESNGDEKKSEKKSDEKKSQIECKVDRIYDAMFRYGYARSYNIMNPRAPGVTGPMKPEEVTTCIFVNDEFGSAARFAEKPNAKLEKFVVVSLHGQAYSLLWLEQNLKAGDAILIGCPTTQIPPPRSTASSSSSSSSSNGSSSGSSQSSSTIPESTSVIAIQIQLPNTESRGTTESSGTESSTSTEIVS